MDSETPNKVLEGAGEANRNRAKTIDDNCEILAEAILNVIDTAKPYGREEQKRAVASLIKYVVTK